MYPALLAQYGIALAGSLISYYSLKQLPDAPRPESINLGTVLRDTPRLLFRPSHFRSYAWLAVACFGMAGWHLGLFVSPSPSLHALTVGGMGGLILAMMARVTLGHTGRDLVPPPGMAAGFGLLHVGALARVGLALLWPQDGLCVAATCWALAFGIFVWRYGPMLGRARVDGHPG